MGLDHLAVEIRHQFRVEGCEAAEDARRLLIDLPRTALALAAGLHQGAERAELRPAQKQRLIRVGASQVTADVGADDGIAASSGAEHQPNGAAKAGPGVALIAYPAGRR